MNQGKRICRAADPRLRQGELLALEWAEVDLEGASAWYTGVDAFEIPDPTPIIADVLDFDSTNVLFGSTGSYKTFLALDMALSIASGLYWLGHHTACCPVLYVLTEGRGRVKKRMRAWSEYRNVEIPDRFHLLAAPVQLLADGAVDDLVELITAKCGVDLPQFVVFDTLSRILGAETRTTTP